MLICIGIFLTTSILNMLHDNAFCRFHFILNIPHEYIDHVIFLGIFIENFLTFISLLDSVNSFSYLPWIRDEKMFFQVMFVSHNMS